MPLLLIIETIGFLNFPLGLLTIWFLTFIILSAFLLVRIYYDWKLNMDSIRRGSFFMLLAIIFYGMLPWLIIDFLSPYF